jgi:hypothetical protein
VDSPRAAEERHERDRSRDRIDLRYRDAAGVERAHECAHAAPDYERWADAETVEDAKNPDVSDPARAAADIVQVVIVRLHTLLRTGRRMLTYRCN